jgi:hypothetical protein
MPRTLKASCQTRQSTLPETNKVSHDRSQEPVASQLRASMMPTTTCADRHRTIDIHAHIVIPEAAKVAAWMKPR